VNGYPGALHTSLYLATAGDGASSAPVATFTHLAGAVVRGSVLPGTQVVLATADTAETRDLSFNATLFRLAPHTPPEVLCNGVVHASRALTTRDGRVFVSRGAPGPEPKPDPASPGKASMRIDVLSIDEVDPWTGTLRTIHTSSGYLAFLAGAFANEVIVYRVSPDGADIAGVDPDTGAVRVIVPSLPPFARDFSVDAATGTLVFQGRHETEHHTWTVERVDLGSGQRSRLHESASMNLVPHAWPGGAVAFNRDGHGPLALLGAGLTGRGSSGAAAAAMVALRGAALRAPGSSGPTADWLLATSEGGHWVTGLHTAPGSLPMPFVLDTETGHEHLLRGPPGARMAVAGFVPADGGAQ